MSDKKRKWITLAVLVAAVALIIVGARTGEPGIVLSKATSICLQCIGIG